MEFLTTSEAANYLRLGERKLYELVTEGAIPCSKVTGKWLFPRHELDLWVLSGLARPAGMSSAEPPPIVGGSQDDLLEWALRESGSGLASLAEGTARGVERLLRGEVIAAAVHFHSHVAPEDAAGDDNIATARALPGLHDAVLVGVARREQGLLLARGNPKKLNSLADVLDAGAKMAVRQPGAGAQMLLEALLARAGAEPEGPAPARTATSHRPRSRRRDPRRQGRLRRRPARRGDGGGARFRAAGLGEFRSPDAAAQLLPSADAGADRFLGGRRLRQRAAELGGYDPAPAGQIRFAA